MQNITITNEKELKNTIKKIPELLIAKQDHFSFNFDMDEFLIKDKLFLNAGEILLNSDEKCQHFKLYDNTNKLRVLIQVNEDETISLRDYNDVNEDTMGYVYLD